MFVILVDLENLKNRRRSGTMHYRDTSLVSSIIPYLLFSTANLFGNVHYLSLMIQHVTFYAWKEITAVSDDTKRG